MHPGEARGVFRLHCLNLAAFHRCSFKMNRSVLMLDIADHLRTTRGSLGAVAGSAPVRGEGRFERDLPISMMLASRGAGLAVD